MPTRAFENNAFVAYVNWVQDDPMFSVFETFHGQTTLADNGGTILFKASDTEPTLKHISFTPSEDASTAIGRPAPNYEDGLCQNAYTSD